MSQSEIKAFFAFLSTFPLSRPVSTVSDLSDGVVFFEVLSIVDPEYFHQPTRSPAQPSDNWVLRFGALKRLYRLMTQYLTDVLRKPISNLDVPNLQSIAKDANESATLVLCRMTITIGVQCEKNKEFIDKIQELNQSNQHHLMMAIEQVMAKIKHAPEGETAEDINVTEDDHYYRLQSERRNILSEKETLEKVYQSLLEEHRSLQTSHDDVVSEKDEALAQLKEMAKESDHRRSDKLDAHLRAEHDRMRVDLQKSEDNLAAAEQDLEKQTNLIADLTKKVDDLQERADEAVRLKDQVDEYRHAAEKLQKTENVMEKYKKKLQEGADLRQHVKALEKQNAELVDTNASLEEDYRKVAAYKPLMDSYKTQIADLETKASSRTQEVESLKFELDQARTKLKITEQERARDAETLDLYQDRVRELELTSHRAVSTVKEKDQPSAGDDEPLTSDSLAEALDADDEEGVDQGLGGELDDAITGTTMTDLKLRVRKLTRQLETMQKNEADASRVLVLENLLEDANRMKTRYENDYLAAHREKLVLQRNLEEIRSGKSMGDGAEAAVALRQRLNETVEQLDSLRNEYTELQVTFDRQSTELTIAKSDLNLVNKDQLDILATLRESVNEDKAALTADLTRTKDLNKELQEKNRMQLEQVNALLLEKVNLQSEGIGQREQALLRERVFGEFRASISGKDLPEDIKARMLALHEENVTLKEASKTLQDKLIKAKQLIKSQDKMFREEHGPKSDGGVGTFEEAEAGFNSQIRILEEDLLRQKRVMRESMARYQREQELMLSVLHSIGMQNVRGHMEASMQLRSKGESWLATTREKSGTGVHRN